MVRNELIRLINFHKCLINNKFRIIIVYLVSNKLALPRSLEKESLFANAKGLF